jgi:hypothetical protein
LGRARRLGSYDPELDATKLSHDASGCSGGYGRNPPTLLTMLDLRHMHGGVSNFDLFSWTSLVNVTKKLLLASILN